MEDMPFQPSTMQWGPLVACLPPLKLCYGYKARDKLSIVLVCMYTRGCLVLADSVTIWTSAV